MIKDILRFLWRRDSESAVFLMVDIANYLSIKDLHEIADFFKQSAHYYERCARDRVFD